MVPPLQLETLVVTIVGSTSTQLDSILSVLVNTKPSNGRLGKFTEHRYMPASWSVIKLRY